ncbi:MAG: polyphosphate kinase 2 [Arcobacteraceae bacterium]|nr:polyphosphate kinase 2 [Arcobacteraceae bacterium]
MNLSDFNTTTHRGLFISKNSHSTFGRKYIARFQINKKRYVKVLGYEKADKLTELKAFALLQEYKDFISNNKTVQKNTSKKTVIKTQNNSDEELYLLKSLLGDYKSIDPIVLEEGIQKIYDNEQLKQYQIELIKMQKYLEKTNKKMIILFEGRDASGKGGAIRRMTRYMNARHYRVVALGKPTETQRHQWFFQKYIEHFPTGGEVVLFDRSWYNRAMVEPIFGFCTPEQHEIFMEDVVNFEHDLVRQDIILVKLYFSVSKDEQKMRFESRRTSPLKQWKLSEVDLQAQDLWEEFSEKKYEMLKRTSSRSAPWNIVRSDDKHKARMEAVKIILNSIDYDKRNYALDFNPDEKINISVQKELARMRKKKDY